MAWYNASWTYRVKITVASAEVDATLTDFPVYVDLSTLPAGFHTNVKSDGGDIRVTTSDETTEVPREVVSYDSGTDTGELHFKAPSLSSTVNTDFYIYYGNAGASEPAASATYGKNNVWTNYFTVYHANQSQPNNLIDSVGNHDTTSATGLSSGDLVSSVLGDGINLDSTDYFTISHHTDFSPASNTGIFVSSWVNIDSLASRQILIGRRDGNEYFLGFNTTGEAAIYTLGSNTEGSMSASYYVSTATDHLVAWWWNEVSGEECIWVDGVLAVDTTTTDGSPTVSSNTYIGRDNSGGTYKYDGKFDELRFASAFPGSTKAGTTAVLAAQYSNQNTPATFYTVGSQETDTTNYTIVTQDISLSLTEDNTTINASGGGGGTITLVTHTSASGTINGATTGSIDTTGANLIVIEASGYTVIGTPTVSDSKSNTWTALTTRSQAITNSTLYYCVAPTVGTGHTFTITSTGGYPALSVASFSGVDVSPFDQQNGNTASSSTTISTNSVTPTTDNQLVITGISSHNNNDISSINSSFTILSTTNWTAGNFGASLAYIVQTTASAVNPTWTMGGSANLATSIATFKAASIGDDHTIVTQDISHSFTLDNTTITQNHILVPQYISHSFTTDNATINQNHVVATQDISHSLTEDNTTVDPYGNQNYTYEDEATLGTDNTDLASSFTISNKTNVETDNNVYFDLEASTNAVKLFKYTHTNSIDSIDLTWKGKTTLAPSSSTVYLQIYNYTTPGWETVDSDNTTAVDTEFTLTGSKTTNLSNYYSSDVVTARVYQVVV